MRIASLSLVTTTIAAVALSLGCKSKPSAMDVCKRLASDGVAANCETAPPKGIGIGAREKATFDLKSVKGKTGQVLAFDDDANFEKTVQAFEAEKKLAGPHRYGSSTARIFVQLNAEATDDDGKKSKAIVDSL